MAEYGQQVRWFPLAKAFPSTLVKDVPADRLEDGQTPNAYGLGLDKPGRLYKGAIVAGDDKWHIGTLPGITSFSPAVFGRSLPDPTTTGRVEYFHNRMVVWNTAGDELWWGALGYGQGATGEAPFFSQGRSYLLFRDDATDANITSVIPSGDDLYVFKPNSLYMVPGFIDPNGRFERRQIRDDVGVAAEANAVEHDGVIYFSHSTGLYAVSGGQVVEVTYPIRNNLGNFGAVELKANYSQNRIVGTDKFIYDLNTKGLYDYGTSGFLWTSQSLVTPDFDPLSVMSVAFEVEWADTSGGYIEVQPLCDGQSVTKQKALFIQDDGTRARLEILLEDVRMCRRWALKVTDMSSNIYISAIHVKVRANGLRGYDD